MKTDRLTDDICPGLGTASRILDGMQISQSKSPMIVRRLGAAPSQ